MKNERILNNFLFFSVFVAGAAVLILEILGARLISPFYGSTAFVWASLITVTLGALSLGYLLGGRLADRRPEAKYFYYLLGISALFYPLIVKVDQVVLSATDGMGMRFGPLAASLMLFGLPLLFLGMSSPYVIRLLTTSKNTTGSTSGKVFAFSTLGSVAGALLAGFFLLPSFSLSQIFTFTGLALAGLCFIGLLSLGHKKTASLMLVLYISVSVLVPKIESNIKGNVTILDQRQSHFGDIKVVQIRDYKCLYVNGSGQTCVDADGHPDGFFPRFLRSEVDNLGLNANSRVLLLGLGGAGIVDILPENISIDIVELDPEVANITKQHFGFAESERVTLIVDDARHYLETADAQYDLILENISLGNHVPYYILSKESFSSMKRLLKTNGKVFAHIGSSQIEGDNSFNEAVYSTAASVFEHVIPISPQENTISTLVLFLSDDTITIDETGEARIAHLTFDASKVSTDDYNIYEHLYLSNAISYRENTKPMGNEIFYIMNK